MSRYMINDFESEAMRGLRYGARALYMAIRERMDYQTGEVGRRPLLSRFALREALYIEPKRGRATKDSGTPSEKVIIRFEEELCEAGLIEYRSIASQKQLIFFLPLASKTEVRLGEVGQVSDELGRQTSGSIETQAQQGFAPNDVAELGQSKNDELGHTSGSGNYSGKQPNLLSIEFSSSSETVPSRARMAGDDDSTVVDEIIPAIPVTARQWWQLVIQAGFTPAQAGQEKAVALYRQWVDLRVTQADFDAALVRAIAARGGLPASPVYLAAIVQQVRSEVAVPMIHHGQGRSAGGGDKPWFVAGDYPVGDKSKAAPYLAGLKQRFRTVQ